VGVGQVGGVERQEHGENGAGKGAHALTGHGEVPVSVYRFVEFVWRWARDTQDAGVWAVASRLVPILAAFGECRLLRMIVLPLVGRRGALRHVRRMALAAPRSRGAGRNIRHFP
jgi:hypothetical protein